MNLLAITITAGPTLIAAIVVLVLLALFQLATQKGDQERQEAALNSIRRCPQCGQVVGQEATTCRHCESELT